MDRQNSDDPLGEWIHQDRMSELGNEDEDYIEFVYQQKLKEEKSIKNKILNFLKRLYVQSKRIQRRNR